jgi:hypothetical protein
MPASVCHTDSRCSGSPLDFAPVAMQEQPEHSAVSGQVTTLLGKFSRPVQERLAEPAVIHIPCCKKIHTFHSKHSFSG